MLWCSHQQCYFVVDWVLYINKINAIQWSPIRSWNYHFLSDSVASVQKISVKMHSYRWENWDLGVKKKKKKKNPTALLRNIQSLWKLELESTWGRENRASKNLRIWRLSETEGKEQNCFFSKKKVGSYITHKWSSLVSTFETFADKLVSFPYIRQGSK